MTSAPAREQGVQLKLMTVLLEAGAKATPRAIVMALAHGELEGVEFLLRAGYPLTAPIAAALGRLEAVEPEDADIALALAVINDRRDAARVALEAGADPNAFLPVNAHSTALHQAVLCGRRRAAGAARHLRRAHRRQGHAVERHAAGLGDPREPPARSRVLD